MSGNEVSHTQKDYENAGVKRVLAAVAKRSWLVALVSVMCAVAVLLGTYLFVTPMYEASVKIYVNNSTLDDITSIISSDLSASRSLVNTYIVILETRETLDDVAEYAGVDIAYKKLLNRVSAKAVDDTEIFEVTVKSENPQEAEKLANAVAYILPKRISSIVSGSSAEVVERAVVPTSPCSPSYVTNGLLGFLLGMALTIAVIAIKVLTDTTIRTEEDIAQVCNYPMLAAIPNMNATGKGGYYGYGQNKDAQKNGAKEPVLIGGEISFAASEAYKLLRTKLQFSFAGDGSSRVIGVSSALSGEGKSLSAVNLAYSMAELGKKVILVDCDMRRPTLAEKLGIRKTPGLSSYLTGQIELEELPQSCGIKGVEDNFVVITAGHNPPNPNELLSSERMCQVLQQLRQQYDYVILDLPPVSEVSDAMTITSETDGTLLVVRENYCDRHLLNDAVHQFEYVNAKILGIVVNYANESTGKYGKSYYKKYQKQYGKAVNPYEAAVERGKKPEQKDN